jgi:hypothetical protein
VYMIRLLDDARLALCVARPIYSSSLLVPFSPRHYNVVCSTHMSCGCSPRWYLDVVILGYFVVRVTVLDVLWQRERECVSSLASDQVLHDE